MNLLISEKINYFRNSSLEEISQKIYAYRLRKVGIYYIYILNCFIVSHDMTLNMKDNIGQMTATAHIICWDFFNIKFWVKIGNTGSGASSMTPKPKVKAEFEFKIITC